MNVFFLPILMILPPDRAPRVVPNIPLLPIKLEKSVGCAAY